MEDELEREHEHGEEVCELPQGAGDAEYPYDDNKESSTYQSKEIQKELRQAIK